MAMFFSAWCSGHCALEHYRGEAAMICPAIVLSLLVQWAKNILQNLLVDLIDHLALWQELAVGNAPHIKLGQSCLFCLYFCFIFFIYYIFFFFFFFFFFLCSWKMFNDVQTSLHAIHFLILLQQSRYHFCSIFEDNLPNNVFLFFFFLQMSSWLIIILTVNWWSPHTYLTRWMLKASNSWGPLSLPSNSLWTSCAAQKCVCNMVLPPYTWWSISRACDGVFPKWTKNF